jgi:hypothetical protein
MLALFDYSSTSALAIFRIAPILGWRTMTQKDLDQKLDEVERLLNDPDVQLEPSRVWSLMDELARQPHPAA